MQRATRIILRGLSACALGALLLLLATTSASANAITTSRGDSAANEPASYTLDHFLCYVTNSSAVNQNVTLQDQFQPQPVPFNVGTPGELCNPVKKIHNGRIFKIVNLADHLVMYNIGKPTTRIHVVQVTNQFGTQRLRVFAPPLYLAVPTKTETHKVPTTLDHFECYVVKGKAVNVPVGLKDEFTSVPSVTVTTPALLCAPTVKVHNKKKYPIMHPTVHLVCYTIQLPSVNKNLDTRNQFRAEGLLITLPNLLCAPSSKKVLQ